MRYAIEPRSRFGPLFGVTRRDIERARTKLAGATTAAPRHRKPYDSMEELATHPGVYTPKHAAEVTP